jgi:hypothetical protein
VIKPGLCMTRRKNFVFQGSLGSLLTKLEPREGPADVVKILCFKAVGRKPRQHPLTKLEPRRPSRMHEDPVVKADGFLRPCIESVGLWLRRGWYVAVAYIIGFFVMLILVGWHPDRATLEVPRNDVWYARTLAT